MGRFVNSEGIAFFDTLDIQKGPGHEIYLSNFNGETISWEKASYEFEGLCFIDLGCVSDVFARAILSQSRDIILIEHQYMEELKENLSQRSENILTFNKKINVFLKESLSEQAYEVLD